MANTVMLGEITQVNSRNGGIKLDAYGDKWLDWSQYADAKKANNLPALRQGMKVRVELDNKDFIRSVSGPNGEPIAAAAGTNGHDGGGTEYARPIRPEDTWRMTLSASLRSASQIIPRLIGPDGKVGEGADAQKPSDATWAMALSFARRVWTTPMPAEPKAPAPAGEPQ